MARQKWQDEFEANAGKMEGTPPPLRVLSEFPDVWPEIQDAAIRIEPLGNAGGFSGARLWRLHLAKETLCLRRWPAEHPDRATLETMHALLQHVANQGFPFVPVPRRARSGATWLQWDGRFWELTPWLPGKANFHQQPHERKLTGALTALAEFHRAAASFSPPRKLPSPGLERRTEQLQLFVTRQASELPRALKTLGWPEFSRRAEVLLPTVLERAPRVLSELERWRRRPVPLQFALRDIWHDHILFDGLSVSGIVDFGALRVESPCGDIARLLGSLIENDSARWELGLEAYHRVCPLSSDERQLVMTFDQSGVLLGVVNWLVWIALERREFDDPSRVLTRLETLSRRLGGPGHSLIDHLGME